MSLKLDGFLEFNEYDILEDNGHISMNDAQTVAIKEFDKFRIIQDETYMSDFDKLLEDFNY